MDSIIIFVLILDTLGLAYMAWALRRLDLNFMSFTDFANNKLSEIEADTNLNKRTLEGQYEGLQLLAQLLDINSIEIDAVKVDFYNHNRLYWHVNDKYDMVKPESAFERELSLAAIELNIPKRAKILGLDIQTGRPEGK